MAKDNSIPKVLVIFLAITLVSSSFTSFSTPVFAVAPGDFIDAFVTSGSGGLNGPDGFTFGPDGNLYVGSEFTNSVLRYNGTTGAFIDAFVTSGSGGLNGPTDVPFGPDGNLYVSSYLNHQVLRYNGTTGAFIDVFVTSGSGGLDKPYDMLFAADGYLYVSSYSSHEVLRYNGTTGAFVDVFVTNGSSSLSGPDGLAFGPDGNLYVSSHSTHEVLRYNGITGAFIDDFVPISSGGLNKPYDLRFGPDGNLYVASELSKEVLRYNGTTGAFIDDFVTFGSGGLNKPFDVLFGPDGNFYVVSYQTDEVLRYQGLTPPVNNPPVAFDDVSSTLKNTPITIDVVANDTDADFDPIRVAILNTTGTLGTVVNNGGIDVTFTPAVNFTGIDSFSYIADDSLDMSNSASVTVNVTSPIDNPPTINIPNPANGTSNVFGTQVNFTGTSLDTEDGPLHPFISWSSDIDGPLGVGGPPFNTTALSIGNHTITASVSDSFGNSVSDAVLVSITPPIDNPPTVFIITPSPADTYVFPASITFLGNATDIEDGDLTASLNWTSDIDGPFGSGGVVLYMLSVGNHMITADVTDSGGNPVSVTIPVNVIIDNPPTVAITGPADGSNFLTGTSITINGTADDVENGNLDASLNWFSNLDGAIGATGTFSTSTLSVGTHTITADVTDSFGNSDSDSITVTISLDVSPTVSITTPDDNDNYDEGVPITFSGSATDPEDGGISNLIKWYSDDDGFIGMGSPITNSSLSVGSHVITASVTDSFGNTDSHSHPIMVNAVVDSPPTVTITAPSDGDNFVNGTLITLSGTAIDSEDGDLSASITWTSDIYGFIGNGSSISTSTAPIGVHVITASVTDSFGNTDSSTIGMIITPEVFDASPSVSIVSPSEGSIYTNVTEVTFSGAAEDPEDGDLSTTLNWNSNLEGIVGTGDSFTYSNLTVGTHTIEASVTDSFGNTDNESITMIITEDSTELIMVCHMPPGSPGNQQQLMIPSTALPVHVNHGDYQGVCIDDDEEEAKKQAKIALVKKQQAEMKNKNELMEKREAFKEIKDELKDLKKVVNAEKKESIKTLVEEIKEVIIKLNEDPEYDKEHKKIIKNEIKEIKREIVNEIKTDAKISKHKIDSKISKLSKSDDPKLTAKQIGLDYENGKTQIAIELSGKDPSIVELLGSIGKIDAKDDKHVQLTVNLSDLPKLRTIGGIDNVRAPFSAVQFEEELSEGVYFINADLAQFSGITGQGVKVAVLDLAFTDNPKITDNIVEVQSFRQGIGYLPIQGSNDEASHGTAVAEILTDVAPDVQLYLYSLETDIEFTAAVDEAISQQVDIIVMSAGWPNFPTDGTSHITKKIEQAVDNGIAFVVPAGNFADKHWEGSFVDSNFNNWHEFSSSDEGLTIEVTEERLSEDKPIIAHLMWDVGMSDVADFELVLVDPLGQIIDYSANEQTSKSDTPFEYIHHAPEIDGIYSIGVLYAGDMSSPSQRPSASLEIFSVNDELEYPISKSSVSVPADANGAIVVGAVNHLDGKLESFSSQGPTNNGKLAPHVVGPDGVTTLSLGGQPFYGTSATAPYVAGLAALIVQTNPDITPQQLLNEIQQNTDNSFFSLQNEFDNSFGYGSVNAIFLVEEPEIFD